MTPEDVGSCYDSTSPDVGGQCSTNYFCAYHSGFVVSGQPVLYANEPYDGKIDGCASGPSPNGTDADTTINTISHEQNEAITDPWGNAWLNADGDEVADICAWQFGTPLGGSGATEYNQVINGNHYALQMDYSNDGSVCRQGYVGIPANTVRPAVTGTAVEGQSLSASNGSMDPGTDLRVPVASLMRTDGSSCAGDLAAPPRRPTSIVVADGRAHARGAGRRHELARHEEGSLEGQRRRRRHAEQQEGTAHLRPRQDRQAADRAARARGAGRRRRTASSGCAATPVVDHAPPSSTQRTPTYKLTKRDAKHRLRVRVTAVNAAGSVAATSSATARVPAKH